MPHPISPIFGLLSFTTSQFSKVPCFQSHYIKQEERTICPYFVGNEILVNVHVYPYSISMARSSTKEVKSPCWYSKWMLMCTQSACSSSVSHSPNTPEILYNYRLLLRSTHDHEDRVRYWLTDAEGGGQPIPDKVFMVMSRPKSKVYYCFIKLSGIFLHKDWNIHSYCFLSRPLS